MTNPARRPKALIFDVNSLSQLAAHQSPSISKTPRHNGEPRQSAHHTLEG